MNKNNQMTYVYRGKLLHSHQLTFAIPVANGYTDIVNALSTLKGSGLSKMGEKD